MALLLLPSLKKAHICKFRNSYNLHFMWKCIKTNFLQWTYKQFWNYSNLI